MYVNFWFLTDHFPLFPFFFLLAHWTWRIWLWEVADEIQTRPKSAKASIDPELQARMDGLHSFFLGNTTTWFPHEGGGRKRRLCDVWTKAIASFM